jgi:hypothetical protein
MNVFLRFLLVFLSITGACAILMPLVDMPFGTVNFWQVHGPLFLVFIAIFPRLTLLLSSVPIGGLLWWISWLFAPRLLSAVLATVAYWNTNKILVTISWLFVLGGESLEKLWFGRVTQRRWMRRVIHHPNGRRTEVIDVEHTRR